VTRLLVVEDDRDILDLLLFKLRRVGFEVESASNGEDAVALALEVVPELVVLDWGLPGGDGLEVCAELRRHPETREVPVILLTARAQEADVQRGLAAGVQRLITKPFSTEHLVGVIRECLGPPGGVGSG
jgi:two-component system phosphate regulon response regulator PhoB